MEHLMVFGGSGTLLMLCFFKYYCKPKYTGSF
jgi:hypothetical protein